MSRPPFDLVTAAELQKRLLSSFGEPALCKAERRLRLYSPHKEFRDHLARILFNWFLMSKTGKPLDKPVRERFERIRERANELREELIESKKWLAEAEVSKSLKRIRNHADKLRAEPIESKKRRLAKNKDVVELLRMYDPHLPPTCEMYDKLSTFTFSNEGRALFEDRIDARQAGFAIEGMVHAEMREAGIEVRALHEQMVKLIAFIDAREKSKGGTPGSRAWNAAMLELAVVFKKCTGEPATASRNKYKNNYFTSPFVKFALIVDRKFSRVIGKHPLANKALGRRVQRLLSQ